MIPSRGTKKKLASTFALGDLRKKHEDLRGISIQLDPTSKVSDLLEIARHLEALTRDLGSGVWPTLIPRVYLGRFGSARVPERKMHDALTCLIVQGVETLFVGESPMPRPSGSSVIVAQRYPIIREVTPVQEKCPYLCLTTTLDIAMLNDLINELGLSTETSSLDAGVVCSVADANLIDTYRRLVQALGNPIEAKVLGPQLLREVYFRLLTGPNGAYVRDLTVGSRKFLRVMEGMEWLSAHLDRQISMNELARHMGMSLSAMHQGFRSICGMTTLEFDKRLLLLRARTILFSEPTDLTGVASRVGYNSTSQFIREYRHFFGSSPGQQARQHGRILRIPPNYIKRE